LAAFNQVHLNFKAQDDVQVVGAFVRLDTDERRGHAVDSAVEFVGRAAIQPGGVRG
jgi:hypothetical protein